MCISTRLDFNKSTLWIHANNSVEQQHKPHVQHTIQYSVMSAPMSRQKSPPIGKHIQPLVQKTYNILSKTSCYKVTSCNPSTNRSFPAAVSFSFIGRHRTTTFTLSAFEGSGLGGCNAAH